MSKFVEFRVHCAYEFGILNHGDETFGDVAQGGVVDRQGFLSG